MPDDLQTQSGKAAAMFDQLKHGFSDSCFDEHHQKCWLQEMQAAQGSSCASWLAAQESSLNAGAAWAVLFQAAQELQAARLQV